MRETLPEVAAATVSPERDRAEEHLHPAQDGVHLADDAVQTHCPRTDGLLVYVQLEVDAEGELEGDRDEEDVGHLAVRSGEECASAVRVSQHIASSCEHESYALLQLRRTSVTTKRMRRTWRGTCHLLRDRPRTMPVGKRTPHTAAWMKMWIHRIESTGAFFSSSESSSWCSCAIAVAARAARMAKGAAMRAIGRGVAAP